MRFKVSEIVERPIDDVFQYVLDLDRMREWAPSREVRRKLTEGPFGVGTKIEAVNRAMGRRFEFVEEIVAYDRPSSITVRSTGDLRGEFGLSLNEVGGATSVEFTVQIQPSSLVERGLDFILTVAAKRATQADFQRLKARMEGSPAGSVS